MKEEKHRFSKLLVWLALLCLVMVSLPVSAQDGDYVPYEPITKIDLGVSSLNLAVGESYTFDVTYEPENTILTTLEWYITDEQVLSVDPLTSTVTALADGEARVFAESIDGVSYAVCDVTVGSAAKDASVMKSGADYFGLSRRDLRKITAPSMVRYLDFIADSALDDEGFDHLAERVFDVLGSVRPGSEKKESRLARELGLDSDPLENLQTVTLTGKLEQILAFVKDNKDLIEVVELGDEWIDDPIVEEPGEEEPVSKTVQNRFNLQGQSDELSGFSKIREFGLDGEDRTIAVIDTGFLSSHEQFLDDKGITRFIKEACFSSEGGSLHSVCSPEGEGGPGTSFPRLGTIKNNHGTHVAGIAAGRDGVAPKVQIIGVLAASEYHWNCSAKELKSYQCGKNSTYCCSYRFLSSNQAKAYNYLIELAKNGLKIDAVNMSYGGGKYKDFCDSSEQTRKSYFDKMIAAGMLPVVAAGNDRHNDATNAPSCISSAYTVAALTDHKDPYIASYSNHHKKIIDIAAPGTQIYSSVIQNLDKKTWQVTCSKNCYQKMNGTSMATPMVTGSIALIRQLYPAMSSMDAGKLLKNITTKSVNKRMNRQNTKVTYTFDFRKPVLNLNRLPKWFSISNTNVKAEKGRVTVTFEDALFQEDYQIRVYDVMAKKWMPGIKYTSTGDENEIRTLDIRGDFQEAKLYRLEIKRWFDRDKQGTQTVVTKYFYPLSLPKTMTAGVRNDGVSLNINLEPRERKNHVIYRVYDWKTNKLVSSIDTDSSAIPQTIGGLNNGQKYNVTAQFYRDLTINKKSYRVYGMETRPVIFMPLNDSFACNYGADTEGVTIGCSEDPEADGIMVLYRTVNNTFTVKNGCTSEKGTFSCKVMDPSLLEGGAQQYIIMKYKYDEKNRQWLSSNTVLTRIGKTIPMTRPEKTLVYLRNEAANATVSMADLGGSDGIAVFAQNNTESTTVPEFVPFCNAAKRACTGNGSEESYLVMRYKKDGDNIYFSPGVYTIHNYGQI